MSKKIMVISSSLDPRLVGAVEAARALGMETVSIWLMVIRQKSCLKLQKKKK